MTKQPRVDSKASDASLEALSEKLSPSRFMRELRPEYYSDTEDRVLYLLDAATLDNHLETLTSRNETHDFELFARKLCERAICPNLRPQTGPEGGGDSKADSETFPVADEISRIYIGEPNSGREKWAFAFSAKKTWAQKARDDVKGIIDTGRSYNRIICVTARYARDKRTSEAEGAMVLLKRAQQLDFSDRIDMIRLLGKAAIGLSKKEHTEQLVEALHLLMVAYRGAGLLWAGRANCAMAAASIVMEGEEDSTIPVSFVPTMKVWAWIALGLRHVPDFLFGIQMLNGALATLPLTDESKERLRSDIQELEYALGSILLNLSDDELAQLTVLPDILEGFGLFMARAALLYTLGYSDALREDGSVPKEESDEGMVRMFDMLASQPVAKQTHGPLILNGQGKQSLSATILGMTVEVTFEGSDLLTVVAEVLLGSIEAFLATVIDQRVTPHTEKFRINLQLDAGISEPAIEISELDMMATVRWPTDLQLTDFNQQNEIRKFFALASGHVLGTTCMIDNVKELLDKLYGDEAVGSRMAMIAAAVNSYRRVASRSLSRLSNWQAAVRKEYPPRARPQITRIDLKVPPETDDEEADFSKDKPPQMRSHRAFSVRSVIDVHAWNKAGWKGIFYFQAGHGKPPGMAFLFEDEKAGRKIFERWRERFGNRDENDDTRGELGAISGNVPNLRYLLHIAGHHPERRA